MYYPTGIKNPLGMRGRTPGLARVQLTHADAKKDFAKRKLRKVVRRFISSTQWVAGSDGEIVGMVMVTGRGTNGGTDYYFDHYYYNLYKRVYYERKSDGSTYSDTGYQYEGQVSTGNSETKPADYCTGESSTAWNYNIITCWMHSGPFTSYEYYDYEGSGSTAFGLTFPGGGYASDSVDSGPFFVTLTPKQSYFVSVGGGVAYVQIEYWAYEK
jgi:hypothetical protein